MANIWHLGEARWASAGVSPLLDSPALSMHGDGPLLPLLCATGFSFLRAAGVLSLDLEKPQRPDIHHLGLLIKLSDVQILPSVVSSREMLLCLGPRDHLHFSS